MKMRRLAFALFVASAVHIATAPSRPQAQAVAASPETRAARVEKGLLPGIVIAGRPLPARPLAERMSALKTPGVSVAVINGGVIEWAKGYGVAETGGNAPITSRTLFQAASLSKPVASLAALRLVEQGKLALDQDVNERLASWKVPESDFTKTEKVTLRRLLSHTAGLTVSGFPGYSSGAAVPSLVQVLDGEKPANTPAIRANVVPGTISRYSGGGYTVMQQLLMDVTGRPFPALLADLALKPIGMTDSTYEQPLPEARRAAAASGHRADGVLLPGRYHTYPEMAAAGLWTTPTDLARFLIEIQMALQGKSAILSASMARQMVTDQKGSYGLGLSLEGAGASVAFGHGGSNAGFKCGMTAFIEDGRGAVVMTNGDQGGRLASEILRAVAAEYNWPARRPRVKTVATVDPSALAPLAGRYELRPGRVLTVSLEGGTLFVIDGQERVELFPESSTRFFELVQESEIEFVRGPDGAVSHMLLNGRQKVPRMSQPPAMAPSTM
jgi:CubicO group peptidase (beta-lactamase class C family)